MHRGHARTSLALVAAVLTGCAGAPPAAPPPVPPALPGAAAGWWRPQPGTAWQWQLTGALDLTVDVPVYEFDGQTTTAAQVAALHAAGRHAICYLSAGSWEAFRPDASSFPPAVLGRPLAGYPDERWLDVRRLDVLGPLLAARLDACRDKGFDAVEADNVDGWQADSGFDLADDDALALVRWTAAQAHDRGMALALKNDLDQVGELVGDVDLAVVEECARYDECGRLQPFVDADKAVLRVEYGTTAADCGPPWSGAPAIVKHQDLDAFRLACPA